jgi:hypothetical protein
MEIMAKTHTKEAAEALLRELPSVVGAYVREDVNGHPREVHLLIGPGPNARHLARDVRDLLEERLAVPIDQRVISIAQLTVAANELGTELHELSSVTSVAPPAEQAAPEARLRFEALETQTREGTVLVRVRLLHGDRTLTGEAVEVDAGLARLRAAATAALNAATQACGGRMRFQLDAVNPTRAFGREYILANVLASSPLIGRRPVQLAGAQPLSDDPDHAAALAALMAINRVISLALKAG